MDVLEYYPPDKSEDILNEWVRKLGHKGILTIGIIDSYAIARGLATYKLDIDQFNLFLYGEGENLRKASFIVSQIADYLESKGLTILKKRIADYRAVIEAQRL
jgi:hypothetical protein